MDSQFAAPFKGRHDHHSDAIATLLAIARQRISEGNPSLALQAVVMALKASGGEGAVLQTLARARGVYINRMNANAAADELAALFAECAIAEADTSLPSGSLTQLPQQSTAFMPPPSNFEHADNMEDCISEGGPPILAESGRMQVVVDASADGSSFICLQCGGLVSNLRKDEHIAYWCSSAPLG